MASEADRETEVIHCGRETVVVERSALSEVYFRRLETEKEDAEDNSDPVLMTGGLRPHDKDRPLPPPTPQPSPRSPREHVPGA